MNKKFLISRLCRSHHLSLNSSSFPPHLLNVVHTYQHPISSLIEDGEFFSQFLLVVHGSGHKTPLPPSKPWPPGPA